MSDTRKFWDNRAKALKGKTIKEARYMTQKEADDFGWYKKPLVIYFTDGTYLIPMMDDEGNDGGSLWGSSDELTYPVI